MTRKDLQDLDIKVLLICIGMFFVFLLVEAFKRDIKTGVLIGIIIALIIGLFYMFVFIFAQTEIFFCCAQDNEPRPIMHVGRKGEFKKFVMSSHTKCFLKNWDIVLQKGKCEKTNVYRECWGSRLFSHIGLNGYKWMGILSRPFIYEFTWAKYKIVQGESVLVSKGPEDISWIYAKEFVYAGEVKDAEVKSSTTGEKRVTPVNVKVALPVEIVNPRKAIFEVEHWLDALFARVEPYIRWHLQSKTFEAANAERYIATILEKEGNQIPDDLKMMISPETIDDNRGIAEIVREKYGVKLSPIEIKQIKFSNPTDKNLYELTYKEQQKAEAAVIKAGGEATSVELIAKAKNLDRELAIKQGLAGEDLFKAQVLQKVGEQGNLIVSNSPVSLFVNERQKQKTIFPDKTDGEKEEKE